mgnify:CR=1 FL=1
MTSLDTPERQIDDALRSNLVPGAVSALRAVSDDALAALPPGIVPQAAVAQRKREFAAGRLAAADAIETLGGARTYPATGRYREPVWPAGIVGSISHTRSIAVAIAGTSPGFTGLGVDIEPVQAMDDAVRAQLVSGSEIEAWAGRLDDQVLPVAVFSYKEALYKCIFPRVRRFVDFLEVSVTPGSDGPASDCVDADNDVRGIVSAVSGRIALCGDHVVSVCWLRAAPRNRQADEAG